MNYTELCAAVSNTIENPFSADDLARFARLTEQKVYNAVQIPALRRNQIGSLSTGNPYLTLPDDFLYVYSLAVLQVDGSYAYVLNKDVNYIREMYPFPTSTGVPRAYAQFDANTLLLGPTANAPLQVELHYGYYPESIVTASTTWLGDNFDSVLLNGMLLEAARFIKEDEDVVKLYDKMFMDSMAQLKQLGDGKLRQDAYRSGQARVPVN
jgi:hypothetical protein